MDTSNRTTFQTASQSMASVAGSIQSDTKAASAATAASNLFDHFCNTCNALATDRCGRCKRVYYCTKYCQKEDWKIHKLNCKPMGSTEGLVVSLKSKVDAVKDTLEGTPVSVDSTAEVEDYLSISNSQIKAIEKNLNQAQLDAVKVDGVELPCDEFLAGFSRISKPKANASTDDLLATAAALQQMTPAVIGLRDAAIAKQKEIEKLMNTLDDLNVKALAGQKIALEFASSIDPASQS